MTTSISGMWNNDQKKETMIGNKKIDIWIDKIGVIQLDTQRFMVLNRQIVISRKRDLERANDRK